MKRALKRIGIGLLALLLVALALGVGGGALWYRSLKASLAELDGEIEVAGLDSPVRIERDALGIPTLRGEHRADLAFATGFLHGQERFFQMDLLRRKAAGELAEWFGEPALGLDVGTRLHRFRHRARLAVESSTPEVRDLLDRYADGVNAGVETLGARPPEYWLPGVELRAWLPEDSYLVLYAMYLELQSGQWRREAWRETMETSLPEPLTRFLLPVGTEWDAPLSGGPPEPSPLPGPEVVDLRARESALPAARGPRPIPVRNELPGSNGWAVAGSRTVDGRALLANDMHLPLGLPNIWYRLAMQLPGGRRLVGHSLPGAPFLVGGSNGRIAWGYTNGYTDAADRVPLEWVDADRELYRTPDGPRPLERVDETILVRGSEPVTIPVQESVWGPRIDQATEGPGIALRWVAHLEGAANGGLFDLERAATVAEAIAIAPRVGIPIQNLMVADRTGSIGWSLIGRLPRRVGLDGSRTVSWADGSARWDGWLDAGEVPAVIDPEEGLVWSANNRVVGLERLAVVGDGGYDLGARASQIRDGLRRRPQVDERAMLAIQLDDRALLLERWRDRLLVLLDDEALTADPRRRQLRELVERDWSGHAAVDETGFRLVRGFRLFAARQLLEPLFAPCLATDPSFRYFALTQQWERPLWTLIELQPPHLLDPAHDSWDDALLAAVDRLLDGYLNEEGARLADRSWGERNTVQVRHPFSGRAPRLSRWLDAPARRLPGAGDMPRVQSPSFGASQRMVVAPGHEEDGLYHMPGGQSGHPLSPHYLAGHEDWVQGYASPLLPGPPEHELLLRPAG